MAVLAGPRVHPGFAVWANVILVGLYLAVGWFVLRTQLANRPSMGGWSVSGLSLSVIFPTCALMHMVWAAYAVAGRYAEDGHGLASWKGGGTDTRHRPNDRAGAVPTYEVRRLRIA